MTFPGSDVTVARSKIYPRHVQGRFRRLRTLCSAALQLLLFALPWVQWEGQQAVLLDVARSQLRVFGLVLHPQDLPVLLLLLLCAGLTMFLVSALAGRMWCGYACPQTLFTQSFLLVERCCEGDRAARMRLDRARWSPAKVARKLAKWCIWSVMGAWLGFTFAGYYLPIRGIAGELLSGKASAATLCTVGGLTALSLFMFGYFREQFCSFVCPYARFQGALLDSDSLIVAYDAGRGEPRGKLHNKERGSCIDCTQCVQACPAGIDIRRGLQLECIACTACVDACDSVMDRVGQARGLVRYTSLAELEGKPARRLRPRVLAYALALLALVCVTVGLGLRRSTLELDAVRVVQPGGELASTTPDGRSCNIFRLYLINRTAHPLQLHLWTEGLPGAEMAGIPAEVQLLSGEVFERQLLVLAPPTTGRGVHHFRFQARTADGALQQKEATFVSP